MKPIQGYDLINEAGELTSLPAGIYGLVITNIVDNPDNEYLEVYFDIAKGDYKDYYKQWMINDNGRDHSKTIRSYKTNALPFFKAFITAVEKSNAGYHWDWDEKKLIGKYVMGVFGEEEYLNKDNQVAVITRLQEFRSVEAFKEGKLKVPPLKKLNPQDVPAQTVATETVMQEVNLDDLPF